MHKRPSSLSEFIGQSRIKKELEVYILSVKKRNDIFPHTFFIGAPGLGKTTLARIIAFELGRDFKVTSGPVLDRNGVIAALLTSLKEGDVLFIDEIHRMPKSCQEILYTAMEDFALDLFIGKGNTGKTVRLKLPKFTLIAATNKPNLCLAPLRDRFVLTFKLDYYTDDELKEIIKSAAKEQGFTLEDEASLKLAKAAKGIPRQGLNLLSRVKEFVFSKNKKRKVITNEDVIKFFKLLEIDDWGLGPEDRRCLITLYKEFKGGPVGIESLALSSNISPEEMESMYEPALIRLGFIARTKRGRILTQKGLKYLEKQIFNNKDLF